MSSVLAYRFWLGNGVQICHVGILGGCSRDNGESLLSILADAGPTVAPRICRSHTFSDEAKPSSQTIVISIGPRSDECRLTRQSQVERVGYRVPIRHSVLHVAPMLDNHVLDMCCTAASKVLRRW
jgi:hypothetical protein